MCTPASLIEQTLALMSSNIKGKNYMEIGTQDQNKMMFLNSTKEMCWFFFFFQNVTEEVEPILIRHAHPYYIKCGCGERELDNIHWKLFPLFYIQLKIKNLIKIGKCKYENVDFMGEEGSIYSLVKLNRNSILVCTEAAILHTSCIKNKLAYIDKMPQSLTHDVS